MNVSRISSKIKVMQKDQITIGIDVSKSTLDICLYASDEKCAQVIDNNVKSIRAFVRSLNQGAIIAMENTGRYNWHLYEVLSKTEHIVYVLNPLHLKKSMGLVRGKSDKVDAERICLYIRKHREQHQVWKPAPKSVQKLKVLLSERKKRIDDIRRLKCRKKDYELMKSIGLCRSLKVLNDRHIKLLNDQVRKIEESIAEIFKENTELDQQRKLIMTIPGVGKILSWYLIAVTSGFTRLNDPRKLACYSGVAPFSIQSGIFKGKDRVSLYADKNLKKLLHLGAMSAIRLNNDLALYYHRKVNEGKNKMSVLNAVRNKIVHRVCSVIKNKKEYQNHLVLS
jgi:transposase